MQFVSQWRWPVPLAAALLMFAIGCTGNGPSSQPNAGGKIADVEVVEVKPVTLVGYEDTITRLKGKVILVDFWFNL